MSPEKWERMQQQGQNHRLNRATRVSSGDSGMALFIVLVLVLVLTVVITQMVFVTQVEKRISQNRQGFVLSLIHISGPRDGLLSRMPSSA